MFQEFTINHEDGGFYIKLWLDTEDFSELYRTYLENCIVEAGEEAGYKVEFTDEGVVVEDSESREVLSEEGLDLWPSDSFSDIPGMVQESCKGLNLKPLWEYREAVRKYGSRVVDVFLSDVCSNLDGLTSRIDREFYGKFTSREELGRSIYDGDLNVLVGEHESCFDFGDYAERMFPGQIYDLGFGGVVVFTG